MKGGVILNITEIEKAASEGNKMPEFSSLADVCCYQAFAALYERYRRKEILSEKAAVEKKQIIKTYQRNSEDFRRCLETYRTYQENIKKSEIQLSNLEKSSSEHEIMCLALEIIENLTSEKNLLSRTLKRLECEKNGT